MTEEKMNVSQWGFQWNDPIDWDKLNYKISDNERKFIRHPSNMGTVMSFNDGKERNVLILDAKYRGAGIFGTSKLKHAYMATEESRLWECHFIGPLTLDDGTTDEKLNKKLNTFVNQDVYTSKENTDFLMKHDSESTHLAGFCRDVKISHNNIEIPCDAPNINTLIRIYVDRDELDLMDPSENEFNQYRLNPWFMDIYDNWSCWSSSLVCDTLALIIRDDGLCCVECSDLSGNIFSPDYVFGFIPVLEL